MATRKQLVALAASDIGYKETPVNITKYWERQKPAFQGGPWCAAAVVDWYEQIGSTWLKSAEHPFYVPSLEALAKENRRWGISRNSDAGDVLIFGNENGIGVHTGILERQYDANHVVSIEGNTSAGNGGSQNDGGGVYRRVRPRTWIRGTVRMDPEFDGKVALPTGVPALLDVDGEMGPATSRAIEWYMERPQDSALDRMDVRAMQTWATMPRTGKLQRPDMRAIQTKLDVPRTGIWDATTTAQLQRFLNRRISEAK